MVKNKKLEDSELLKRYLAKEDLNYLSELFQRYTHLVYGTCLKYLKNEEDSKDAVMQIFEKLIRKVKKHDITNFGSWLYILAKNHCLMWLRAQKQHKLRAQQYNADQDMEISYEMHLTIEEDTEDYVILLEKELVNLSPEQKICIELFYLENKSYKEIAHITGYDFKKVKSYIQNGKRNLKQRISDLSGRKKDNE